MIKASLSLLACSVLRGSGEGIIVKVTHSTIKLEIMTARCSYPWYSIPPHYDRCNMEDRGVAAINIKVMHDPYGLSAS